MALKHVSSPATIVLSFHEGKLRQVKFWSTPDSVVVRASPMLGGRYHHLRWGSGLASLILFLLHQAYWVAADQARAEREIEKAIEAGQPVAGSAPQWFSEHGTFVATLAELLKQRHRPASVIKRIFGVSSVFEIGNALCYRKRWPSVWLDVSGILSPLRIEIQVDGRRTTDPQVIASLMMSVAATRGWSIDSLFLPPDEEVE